MILSPSTVNTNGIPRAALYTGLIMILMALMWEAGLSIMVKHTNSSVAFNLVFFLKARKLKAISLKQPKKVNQELE